MHDLLLGRQDRLEFDDLIEYAVELALDVEQFRNDLAEHLYTGRVAQDVESADLSGASGTPTFFINGQRHYGAYDLGTLSAAIKTARTEAAINSAPHRNRQSK
jgi:predicted DsbA family dithiol-disulfide isomerase